MTVTTRTRKSRFIFQWESCDGLDYQGRVVARTQQIGTFDRGGTTGAASAIDAAGKVYIPGYKSPRFHHQYNASTGLFEPVGLLLEGARTNLVVQSDAITAGAGWTIDQGGSATAAYDTVGALSLSRCVSAGGGSTFFRAVTLTGDGVKACSWVVKYDGFAHVSRHSLYDGTAGARCRIDVTWAADGTATAAAIAGTLLAFMRLGNGAYRILAQSTACTAANAHIVYAYQDSGAGTGHVRVGAVQVEDAAFPSSIISTTTTAVTRSADALSFTYNAPPQAMTVYAKIQDLSGAASGTAPFLYEIADAGGNSPLLLAFKSSGVWAQRYSTTTGTSDSTAAAGASIGDTVELRGFLTVTGANVTSTLGQSINGAAEVVAAAGTSRPLVSAWSSPTLLHLSPSAGAACAAVHSIRIAAGVQTMDYCRAG